MLGMRLAEQSGRADVDALMEETPTTALLEWAAWWSIQGDWSKPEKDTPAPDPDAEMTPEIAESLVTGFRGVLGVKSKRAKRPKEAKGEPE